MGVEVLLKVWRLEGLEWHGPFTGAQGSSLFESSRAIQRPQNTVDVTTIKRISASVGFAALH
jgi:hypothetical protein